MSLGRTVLNVWRRMKAELKLSRYTVQSTVAHVLKKRLPEFTNEQMNHWYKNSRTLSRVFKHLYRLVSVNLDLLDNMDLVRRTAESARLYGIDFFSVLSRGSQYRVEAVMLRVAHKLVGLRYAATFLIDKACNVFLNLFAIGVYCSESDQRTSGEASGHGSDSFGDGTRK